ncbi:Kiwa anti-phage protein KwaB-like domain-containing protein [Mammaliicoccus sciuri]|uniref:Kiwa anti-phage protein KwaB-like domain-containing protein n=1 Tax=Mammaliicoccus sciuri TaxID=1296 RepID=UPI001C3DF084|nr:Kiwa anti-phage protein KwaB-like domain-containing protein [Mammaliicoccus sciuri]MBV5103463.1 DUF4868 domain-containing protein [Mammaliicoccus sciuri]
MLKDINNGNFNYYLYLVIGKHLDNNSGFVNLPITDNLKTNIEETCLNYVSRINDSVNFEEYNLVGKNDGLIEIYNFVDNYMNIDSISEFLIEENRLINIQESNLKTYTYFIIKVVDDNEEFFFVRKPNKSNSLKKGTLMSKLQNGRYELIEGTDLIEFDNQIDYIESKECFYIFSRSSFEKSFKLEEVYNYLTHSVLNKQVFKDQIENFDEFIIDVESNAHLRRRIARLFERENTDLFLKQIDETIKICEEHSLELNFDGDTIVYDGKEQAEIIVSFMQDAYYQTRLGQENGSDNRR